MQGRAESRPVASAHDALLAWRILAPLEESLSKTRVGAFEVTGQTRTEPLPFLSSTSHRSSSTFSRGIASDLVGFLSEDPLGFDQGPNFYTYVRNSPIGRIDPLGLAQCYYSVSAHTLVCWSDDGRQYYSTKNAYSGRGDCKDDSSCESEESKGPIPRGPYSMTPLGGTPIPHTPPRVGLNPVLGTATFGRTAFQIHPEGRRGSEGCIVIRAPDYKPFCGFYCDPGGVLVVMD